MTADEYVKYPHHNLFSLSLGLSRECMFLGSLSHHNKDLEQPTLKPLVLSGLGQTMLQLLSKSMLQLYFI